MEDAIKPVIRFLYFLAGVYIVQMILAFKFIPAPITLEEFALIVTIALAMFGYLISLDNRTITKFSDLRIQLEDVLNRLENLDGRRSKNRG